MAVKKLVVFDVDGTLIDSQSHIIEAMLMAFKKYSLDAPSRSDIRSIIGLSLPEAMIQLYPTGSKTIHQNIIDSYIDNFSLIRKHITYQKPQLFPGILLLLKELYYSDDYILGIATGKGCRGLDYVLESNEIKHYFSTIQTADNHPSKPHPSMLFSALKDAGVSSKNAVVIGDTTYDMDMGKAAKFKTIGVSWGYHSFEIMKRNSDIYVAEPQEISMSLKKIFGVN
tara:strand:+ start:265 stop:942 length:678 start_codon:yes stop_codon:yes gene_type:complete